MKSKRIDCYFEAIDLHFWKFDPKSSLSIGLQPVARFAPSASPAPPSRGRVENDNLTFYSRLSAAVLLFFCEEQSSTCPNLNYIVTKALYYHTLTPYDSLSTIPLFLFPLPTFRSLYPSTNSFNMCSVAILVVSMS